MAKQKQDFRKIGVMLVLIVVVWGAVFYQIFFKNGSDVVPSLLPVNATAKTNKTEQPENYKLKKQYQDPFLGKKIYSTKSVKSKPVQTKKNPNPKPKEDHSVQFKYQGNITDKSLKTAYISFSNRTYLLNEGDSLQQYKLLKIENDSVKLAIGKEKFWVTKLTN